MHTDLFIPSLEQATEAMHAAGSPLYLTHIPTVLQRLDLLRQNFPKQKQGNSINSKIFYAMKANYNPDLLRALKQNGLDGIDAVSPLEIEMALRCGFSKEQIIFTGNYSSAEELAQVLELGILCNIGSLMELENVGKIAAKRTPIAIRLKPSVGAGEFKGTITGGKDSKFGIALKDLAQVKSILERYDLDLVGIHCHIGSGFYRTDEFETAVRSVLQVAKDFTPLQFIDCGGGFGARYRKGEQALELGNFARAIEQPLLDFQAVNGSALELPLELRLEPGKFLVAESTVLLCRVTAINESESCTFVGTDTGFNHLIRPALYGAYHHAVNLSGEARQAHQAEQESVKIVGNICESSDIMVEEAKIAKPQQGDILALLTAGAYGASMHSLYNLRLPPAEALLQEDGTFIYSRKRKNFSQLLQALNYETL